MAEETKLYVLTKGTHSVMTTKGRVRYKEGESVPLTAKQYEAFKDRFKPRAAVIAEQDAQDALNAEDQELQVLKAAAEAQAKAQAEKEAAEATKEAEDIKAQQDKAAADAAAVKAQQEAEAQAQATKAQQQAQKPATK